MSVRGDNSTSRLPLFDGDIKSRKIARFLALLTEGVMMGTF